MSEQQFTTLDEFVTACQGAGITDLAVAWRQEWGPGEDGELLYDHLQVVRCLGYRDGTILSCNLEADKDATAEALREAGFTVELRCRNLTLGKQEPR